MSTSPPGAGYRRRAGTRGPAAAGRARTAQPRPSRPGVPGGAPGPGRDRQADRVFASKEFQS